MDIVSQIRNYLELLNMRYAYDDEHEQFELIFTERKDEAPAEVGTKDDPNYFKYKIIIKPSVKWIQIWCDVYPLDKIPEMVRTDVLLQLLHSNRRYAEVCFDYDEEMKMIGTSQEMMIQGLNFDSFREEFLAVPWAVKKFWSEIAKDYKLE